MTKHCATCNKRINDWTDIRYTMRGDTNWYCTAACVTTSMING